MTSIATMTRTTFWNLREHCLMSSLNRAKLVIVQHVYSIFGQPGVHRKEEDFHASLPSL